MRFLEEHDLCGDDARRGGYHGSNAPHIVGGGRGDKGERTRVFSDREDLQSQDFTGHERGWGGTDLSSYYARELHEDWY